jgi:hypothetical protein
MEEIQDTATAYTPEAVETKGRKIARNLGIALVVILILAAMGASIYGLVSYPDVTAVLRDVFIIVLALVTIIIGLFLVILIFQLQSLIALLRDEIKPILESANETASTVRGTTTFVSDAVVTPVIQAASYVAAVRQTVKTLVGDGRKSGDGRKKGQRRGQRQGAPRE